MIHIESGHPLHNRDNRANRIYQQMYSPSEFKRRAYYYADNGIDFSVEFIYEGEIYRYDRARQDFAFWDFVRELGDGRGFQEWLFYGRPQHCIH